VQRLLWQFFATLIIAAVLLHFIWWIVASAALIGFAVVCVMAWQHYTANRDAEAKRVAAISARADQQHRLWMQGDGGGLYGQYPAVPL
jgi:lysylphosphatidylglycerol synthetase-like protein (DUF2156 family)